MPIRRAKGGYLKGPTWNSVIERAEFEDLKEKWVYKENFASPIIGVNTSLGTMEVTSLAGTPTLSWSADGLVVTTGSTSGNNAVFTACDQAGVSVLRASGFFTTAHKPFLAATIVTPSALATHTFGIGFAADDIASSTGSADSAILESVNGAAFTITTRNNSTTTVGTVQNPVTPAVSTAYNVLIYLDANRVPHYEVNGIYLGAGAALQAATALVPVIYVQTGAAATRSITLRNFLVGKYYT
jgi:hypothetical protein